MRKWIILMLATLPFVTGEAQAQSYGTELPFVVGSSARITSMGGSGVSLRGDASIQYYNPAGLSYLQWKQFAFFRTSLLAEGSVYHAASYAHPVLNHGTIGISLLRVDVGGIEERDINNQLLSDDLHNAQTRILLGYAQNISSSLAGGFNIKVDNHSLGSTSGTGVGLDVGLSARQHVRGSSFFRGFRQGFVIQNLLEPSVKLDQEAVSDPLQLAVGVSVLSAVKNTLLETTLELVSPRYSPLRIQIGQEIRYADHFSFRVGMSGSEAAAGLGGRYKNLAFDYAYLNTEIGNKNQISFSVRFGSSLSERKHRERARLEREVNLKINERMDELERTQIVRSLQRGDSLYALEQFDDALSQYESVLLWDPDNAHAVERVTLCRYNQLMDWAQTALVKADFVQAAFFSKQALDIVPKDSRATAMISLCNKKIAQSQEFAKLVNDLLKKSIDLYANRQYAKALAGFDEVLTLDPKNQLAREYRDKSILHINTIVEGYLADAKEAYEAEDWDRAIDNLEHVLLYKPHDQKIRQGISDLVRNRDAAAAAEKAAEATTIEPLPVATQRPPTVATKALEEKYNRGMEYFNKGELEEAVKVFMEVWSADPNYHDVSKLLTKAYLLIGMRAYARDQYAEAVAVWKRVLVIDPDNVKARRYLNRTNEEFRKLSRVTNE